MIFGKIATPLEVMNKATRLDYRLPAVLQRLDYVILQTKNEFLEQKLQLLESGRWEKSPGKSRNIKSAWKD